MGDTRSKNTKVRTAIFSRFRPGMARYPDEFPYFQIRILSDLAEQSYGAVFQITERTISAHGSVKTIEILIGIFTEIDCRQTGHHSSIGEFSDALGHQRAIRIGLSIIQTVIFLAIPALCKPRNIR